MAYRTDKRLYLNTDKTKVVDEGHPDAAYLLAGEGQDVSDEDAWRYGLHAPQHKAEQAPADTKAEHAAAEDKAVDGPRRGPRRGRR